MVVCLIPSPFFYQRLQNKNGNIQFHITQIFVLRFFLTRKLVRLVSRYFYSVKRHFREQVYLLSVYDYNLTLHNVSIPPQCKQKRGSLYVLGSMIRNTDYPLKSIFLFVSVRLKFILRLYQFKEKRNFTREPRPFCSDTSYD